MVKIDHDTIKAIEKALSDRKRVELLEKDGQVIAQTIERKRIKVNSNPTA